MKPNALRRAGVLSLLLLPLLACRAKEETIGISITGVDHLAEHLSIQNYWVNSSLGHQAGKGGRKVCCATIPAASAAKPTVRVRWAVTNWKCRVYGYYEREVPVGWYEDDGQLWIHFLRDGSVRAVISMALWLPDDPSYPSEATLLQRKQPWTDYQRRPGEPEFSGWMTR